MRRARGVAPFLLAASVLLAAATAAAGAVTERVSVDSNGAEANAGSTASSISSSGRFVAFVSSASNLVGGDTNAMLDVFVHDRTTGATERASVDSSGAEANGPSSAVALSGDGRWVVFASTARNLVANDTNNRFDVFVHDRASGATERVSLADDDSEGNADSFQPAVSSDGRFVAFASLAGNLVAADSNGTFDVFVRDRATGSTERVSVASDGTQGNGASLQPRLSADGRFVVFHSQASNLVPGDTNGVADVFVHDRVTGTTERVSVDSNGVQGDRQSVAGTLSGDGRFVAFSSDARNLVAGDSNGRTDVFVHDRVSGTTERASVSSSGTEGNNSSGFVDPPALSADGSLVAFATSATNLVPGDANNATDMVLHDRTTGATTLVHVATDGTQGNANAVLWPQISADGRVISFTSMASNLVAGDGNSVQDVFVYADTCGNGALDAGEECDDGNALDGDCCTARCRFEPTGSACSDGDACTQVDACDGAGVCVGSSPVVCTGGAAGVCQGAASCDPATGQCVQTTAPDGTLCDDGDACTAGDACVDGECVPGEVEPKACLDSFRCYDASLSWQDLLHFRPGKAQLADQLGSGSYWLGAPSRLCAPARVGDADGEPVPDLSGALLSCRHIERTTFNAPAFAPQRLTVTNDLGAQTLTATAPRRLCLGAGVVAAPPASAVDPFTCYAAKVSPGTSSPAPQTVAIADGLATSAMVVSGPKLLCNPASVDGRAVTHPTAHLVCYELSDPDRRAVTRPSPALLKVATALGPEKLSLFRPRRLCLPTRVDGVAPEPKAKSNSGGRR